MTTRVIEHKSYSAVTTTRTGVLELNTYQGIQCVWSGKILDNPDKTYKCTWKFEWDGLKRIGVTSLTGQILTKITGPRENSSLPIEVNLNEQNNIVEQFIPNIDKFENSNLAFEYHLTPLIEQEIPNHELLFQPSDQNDTILLVEGKRMHVNKAVLTYHSDYFRSLFTSNFKEKQMDEVPIEDVSFEDMGLLLSMIIPLGSFPNDETCEKVLELADRFLMSSVKYQVEHFLINYSKIKTEQLLWMGDKYKMQRLLENTINGISSAYSVKKIVQSPQFNEITDKTKAALLNCVVNFI